MTTSLQKIGIIGSGPAALVTAYVLIKDGFDNVQLITRDRSPGGIWAKEKVYPDLLLNNVHGQLRFSAMEMEAPPNAEKTGGRLTGEVMSDYLESFAKKFLPGHILYGTEVINVRRPEKESKDGWVVAVKTLHTGTSSELYFDKIVLCTGGCSNPRIPSYISPQAAEASQFRGLVIHSSRFSQELPNILNIVKAASVASDKDSGRVVIIGCGKSAQDMSAYLANRGRRVTVVYEQLEPYMASPRPLAKPLRQGRIASAISPYSVLRSNLERFLHTTKLGSKIVRFIFNAVGGGGFRTYNVPEDSPLRLVRPFFWQARVVDDGLVRPTSFYALSQNGQIELCAPARAIGFSDDGSSIVLNNGQKIKADVVIVATGYRSSWESIFDDHTAEELGIKRHVLPPSILARDEWASYCSWPSISPKGGDAKVAKPVMASPIYRGIVPAKSILNRDVAINGAILAGNNGYIFEVVAHWISSYFLGDKLKLPSTPELALEEAYRHSAWCEKRFPGILGTTNESLAAALHIWSWPQAADELLEDMHLKSGRSGGNWFNWIFKPIDSQELESLTEERRLLRNIGKL